MPATTLINISNRLPVTIGEEGIVKSSGGLVAALEGLPREQFDLKWIGWPGKNFDDPADCHRAAQTLAAEHGCTPVFIPDDQAGGFYEGFSNSSVWPLLHYFPAYFRYEPHWWDDYEAVNRRFAEVALEAAHDGDLVWVHDYQLMLLPAMLKSANPSLRIGFFLHTPFPSYEIFRFHPKRRELIMGVLGADLVGFHTFGYMRHFRSAVLRLLGIESEITRVRHDGRVTTLGIYPIGINAPRFEQELDRPEFLDELRRLREAHRNKRIIISVERVDYTKGILHRLSAIDMYLADLRPDERERLKFIFVSVPSRENVAQYRELTQEVETRIGRLNGKYATLHDSPIQFIHGSVNFTQLCALYAAAEVGLITPLIDGMNLVAKEYVACQREETGALILSEFAGAAEELFNAIIVNPYDTLAVARAIDEALHMPVEQKRERIGPMRERVISFDAAAWARSFMKDLSSSEIRPPAGSDLGEPLERVRGAIARGQKVALMLDYDGTLREIERSPAAAVPTAAVREVLEALRDRPSIDVTIISGRTPRDLESFLGSYPFGLIGEHGAALRRPHSRQWEHLDQNLNYSWKPELLKVLRHCAQSTPGSFVEDKRTSLVWHYRQADPEFGSWKAKELTEELAVLTASEPLNIRHGRKIVEITSTHLNKGNAIMRLLEERKYDLIVVAGDDATDESMFRLDVPNLITIHVGAADTRAQYRVSTPADFRRFLLQAIDAVASAPRTR